VATVGVYLHEGGLHAAVEPQEEHCTVVATGYFLVVHLSAEPHMDIQQAFEC